MVGGIVEKKYYWRANLARHHAFQGKQIFYCGLDIRKPFTVDFMLPDHHQEDQEA